MTDKPSPRMLQELAWIGDSALSLAAREWILDTRGEIDGDMYTRLTSNEFLSHFGNPTRVEAHLGELYRDGGLSAVKTHFLTVFVPLYKRQETNRRRH